MWHWQQRKDNGRTSNGCHAGKSKADNRIKSVQL